MICAIDFGSCRIRSVFRNRRTPERLKMFSERSEYAMLANTEQHRMTLERQAVPHAECDQALVVFGNHAASAQWLSRVPRTSLLTDGIVPTNDPPARQILSLLTESMLPAHHEPGSLCVFTVPGPRDGSDQAKKNEAFLYRLVQMRGYRPLLVNPAEASLLATCSDAAFTGISIVMGAETTTICIARYGIVVATETLTIGGNWIDAELARQFRIQMFDEAGTAFLDLCKVREWKFENGVSLTNSLGDRERLLGRLYKVVLDQVTATVGRMLVAPRVRAVLNRQRLAVMLAGGAVMVDGFADVLTEQFIQHEIAERILSLRVAADPETAVVRGALIYGELESRALTTEGAA